MVNSGQQYNQAHIPDVMYMILPTLEKFLNWNQTIVIMKYQQLK